MSPDAVRIAELQAEVAHLRDQMATLEAVLGVDLHANKEFRALRAAQHRNGGGSGFGFLHVQHESAHRISVALLEAVEKETERLAATSVESVNPTALARWTMPHGVVPSLVAEHVVAPFADPDCIVTGPGAPRTALINAQNVRDAHRGIMPLINPRNRHVPSAKEIAYICRHACEALEGDDLRRFVEIATPFTVEWPGLAFLCNWCAFREAGRSDESAAAARVFATAWHAADWHEVQALRLPHPYLPPRLSRRSAGHNTMVRLAALATTPADVIAMCNVSPIPFSGDAEPSPLPFEPERKAVLEIPWSTEFWTNFFTCLAPKATTDDAVEALCTAVGRYSHAMSMDDGLDVDAIVEFFVALLPAVTSDSSMMHAITALLDISPMDGTVRLMPTNFYRDFFLPLAHKAASPGAVQLMCQLFEATFKPGGAWAIDYELVPVLTSFVSNIYSHDKKKVYPGTIGWLCAMIKLISRDRASVTLLHDMFDSVILPLLRHAPYVKTTKDAASELHEALTVIVADRVEKGDTSGTHDYESMLRHLEDDEEEEEEEDEEDGWPDPIMKFLRGPPGPITMALNQRDAACVPKRYGPEPDFHA